MTLIRIEAPHFVAGAILDNTGRVRRCAPILARWIRGMHKRDIIRRCNAMRWQWHISEAR